MTLVKNKKKHFFFKNNKKVCLIFRNIWKYTQSHQKNTWLSYDHWFQPEAGNFRFYFEAIKRASQSPAVVEMDDITTTISDRAACGEMIKFNIILADKY